MWNKILTKPLFYIIKVLGTFYIYNPILIYFLLEDVKLSYTNISIITSSYYLGILVFGIPAGYISDSIGRKKSMIIGYLIQVFAMVLLFITLTFSGSLCAYIVLSLGIALVNSADSALLYEMSIALKNSESEIGKNRGNMLIATLGSGVLASFLCSLIIGNNYRISFAYTGILFLTCAILSIFLSEDRSKVEVEKIHIKAVFESGILRNRKFLSLGLYYCIYSSVYGAIYMNIQTYMSFLRLDSMYSGYIYIVIALLPLATIQLDRLINLSKYKYINKLIFIISLIFMFLTNKLAIGMISLFFWRATYGLFYPTTTTEIDKFIGLSPIRATLLSFISLGECFLTTVLIIIYGYIADSISLNYIMLISVGIIVLYELLRYIFSIKNNIEIKI